jgi:hypothetical protein
MPNPQKPRWFAGALISACAALTLPACGTVEEGLVGKPFGTATAKPVAPPLPPSANFSAVDLDSTGPVHGGLHAAILPPTLTPPVEDGPPEAVATSNVHHVLAAVALGADSAPLAAAADGPDIAPDARFVLLVLTPSAPDAATLDKNNEASKTAADNAIRALAGAGIAEDRVEIAAATSTAVGPGEVRLYVR